MERIESRLSTASDEFRRNREAMESLVKRLRAETRPVAGFDPRRNPSLLPRLGNPTTKAPTI